MLRAIWSILAFYCHKPGPASDNGENFWSPDSSSSSPPPQPFLSPPRFNIIIIIMAVIMTKAFNVFFHSVLNFSLNDPKNGHHNHHQHKIIIHTITIINITVTTNNGNVKMVEICSPNPDLHTLSWSSLITVVTMILNVIIIVTHRQSGVFHRWWWEFAAFDHHQNNC